MGRRVAVVGGGVAGLAAAVRLRERAPAGTEVVVYEGSGALGGKLRTGTLAGVAVERGAESFLSTGPDGADSAAVRLARRVGLGDALVHPVPAPAALALEGALLPVPPGTLVGVPADPAALGPVAAHRPGADADLGAPLLAPGADVAVGALVRERYGDEVVDRLVDPLLGGVYAGRADALSLEVTVPALAAAARTEHTLAAAVRAARAASAREPGRPVFTAVAGGLSRLVAAAAAASGARVELGRPVRELHRTARGWRLVSGPVPAPRADEADAVVLAVPARPAARLLSAVAPDAADAVGVLDYASVALVALALPPGTALPELSGFLVPATQGTLVKAATFVSGKWGHAAGGPVVVRASLGRVGEQRRLQADDAALTATAHAELGALLGAPLPPPVASWVQRWGGGLPQYAPGHRARAAAARAAVAALPGLALAGAALDGVGVPACVAGGGAAADRIVDQW